LQLVVSGETESLRPAIVRLVGVVVGGLITAGVQLWNEKRRYAREAYLECRRRRAAARLSHHQLSAARFLLRHVREAGDWWPEVQDVPTDIDPSDRRLLAEHLGTDEWKTFS
jgi:hypothetical protein